ncbi:hypothetical protein J6O48_14080 [bacterium]|nr:hypothetical protein [bacterium]
MKAYTDLEQSIKLSDILSLESADMRYSPLGDNLRPWVWTDTFIEKDAIPCWSLTSLLDVIPQEIFDNEYVINITEGCDDRWVLTYDHCENRNHSYYGLSSGADNLVDACVEMIVKLHNLKLISYDTKRNNTRS